MNNRQFLITAMFFLLVITGYNQFVALPRAKAAEQAAKAQLLQQEKLHAAAPAAVVGPEGAYLPRLSVLLSRKNLSPSRCPTRM